MTKPTEGTPTVYRTHDDFLPVIEQRFAEVEEEGYYLHLIEVDLLAEEMLVPYEYRDDKGNLVPEKSGYIERDDLDFYEVAQATRVDKYR